MKNINITGALTAFMFVTVLSFGALGFAPSAHAQFDGGDYSGGCCDFGTASYTPSDYGTASYTPSDYGTASYSPTDYGTATYAPDYGTATYDSSTPSYSTSGYSTGGYSTGGYSTGGYSTGSGYGIGYTTMGGYQTPVYNTPVVSTPSNTNVNTNTCTGNSCNKDDHSVVNITNPAPVINNNNVVANYAQPQTATYPSQPSCAYGYSGIYPNCYRAQPIVYQQPPVAYNNTPYVSLSQVPYTGLDLGFWGSIAYWGAFVLFALFAAYLIAIKRVQNTMANYLKSVLFGTDEVEVISTEVVTAPAAPAPAPETTNGDAIDSFIMSQINRARHA